MLTARSSSRIGGRGRGVSTRHPPGAGTPPGPDTPRTRHPPLGPDPPGAGTPPLDQVPHPPGAGTPTVLGTSPPGSMHPPQEQADPPPPCEQNHGHLYKHYLPATSFAGGKY